MSLCSEYVWHPDKVAQGDVDKIVDGYKLPIMGGVYCYKDFAESISEATAYLMQYRTPAVKVVVGRIQLWGEVVEHERGWRGQYAKIISFNGIYPEDDAKFLQLLALYTGGKHVQEPKSYDSRSWTGRKGELE